MNKFELLENRLFGNLGLGLLCLILLAGCASNFPRTRSAFQIDDGAPYSQRDFRNDPADVQFAIVSDRNGGARPGVFEGAIDRLNLLQPEFVVTVGDSIAGYTEDKAQLEAQWDEFEGIVGRLEMPFFYTVGNHDMGNDLMREVWKERRGKEYYHFVYKNVLFMVLDTDDPPTVPDPKVVEDYVQWKKLLATDPAKAMAQLPEKRLSWEIPPKISDAQVAYFKQVVLDNPQVRWIFCFVHKPAWEFNNANFKPIEALLAGHSYTMFCGHEHNYHLTERNGHDYIQLGSTGGVWHHTGVGNMDHVTWVTMTDKGPVIANLVLNGMIDKNGPVAESESKFLKFQPVTASAPQAKAAKP